MGKLHNNNSKLSVASTMENTIETANNVISNIFTSNNRCNGLSNTLILDNIGYDLEKFNNAIKIVLINKIEKT